MSKVSTLVGQNANDLANEQQLLFEVAEFTQGVNSITVERIQETYLYKPVAQSESIQIHNRRYIGSKYKLIEWIFSILKRECDGDSFADIFAGTGIVSAVAAQNFKKIILNDFLHSNHAIYQAFFGLGDWNKQKVDLIIDSYNRMDTNFMHDNYFSRNFGNKYFSINSAKLIGFIRDDLEVKRKFLTKKEYYILLASLLYSVDKVANTVGHYDAYFKKDQVVDKLIIKRIEPLNVQDVEIYKKDTNHLVKNLSADIVYIDPPYNSRQYSRFYHVLETLTKWNKAKLHGVALKPDPENMSDYCRNSAGQRFQELIGDIKANYIAVSYNNTYESKSSSSKNKITLNDLHGILANKGETKVFEKGYRHFNAGNTKFNNHKEFLFLTKVTHA